MVETIRRYGCEDARVLTVMAAMPRHRFIPGGRSDSDAYADMALPIGYGATISQPFIVAHMTALLDPRPDERILEVGTGSGYQAAILARLAGQVYSVERVPELVDWATRLRDEQQLTNLHIRHGDGAAGWPEAAPFDGMILTCAPECLPRGLLRQLRDGGRIVAPIGDTHQVLQRIEKHGDDLRITDDLGVRFVPMR